MLDAQQQQIVRLLHAEDGLSRTELAKQMDVSKAAMSHLVRKLIDQHVVVESLPSVNGQGRPSVLLTVCSDRYFFIGVSLLGEQVELVLVDLADRPLAHIAFEFVREPAQLAANIASHIEPLLAQTHVNISAVLGVGIALSGVINKTRDHCIKSTLLGWSDVALVQLLQQHVQLPIYLENDAKSLAIHQHLFGLARDVNNFALLTHSDGIGSAQFIHGQLYRGAHGGAGEIAHTTIELNGLPCRCGKRGCLDTVSSLIAIRENATRHGLSQTTIPALEGLAMTGDSTAIGILHRAGNALGLAIAHVIQLNDPQSVLIAHHPDCFNGLFATLVKQSIDTHVLPDLASKIQICPFALHPQIWTHAAASVAIHQFLHQPLNK
ncbi:ROK family transcriptional regulator [Celerinatantimonas yamalensis]|uniref:ROK family transcriptional regulator n=1 Tax=Celerinatantimonas yamalensis TaxID=559956 RepID=A0ABW9G6N7_9GAMM